MEFTYDTFQAAYETRRSILDRSSLVATDLGAVVGGHVHPRVFESGSLECSMCSILEDGTPLTSKTINSANESLLLATRCLLR